MDAARAALHTVAVAAPSAPPAPRRSRGLHTVSLLPVDRAVLAAAALLCPTTLRTLDAIHVATAISLSADVGVVLAYDERLLDAAAANGLAVRSPR